MNISTEARKRAMDFFENEKQFQLGMLPTEQSNSKTKGLDEVFKNNTEAGVKMLFSVDEDMVPMAERIFSGKEFAEMLESSYRVISNGGKIIFSGCGATGRLSILLESMWRTFFQDLKRSNEAVYSKVAQFEDRVFSIMTGGDYALIKSVESFEDYPQFGRRQAQELSINSNDALIAITEGGETSSVLGSLAEALDVGAKAFLLFNNPADILSKYIERSRKAIEDPRVTVLDLFCGSMAIAGSTRMQATSSEQLVAGAMLEKLISRILKENLSSEELMLFPESDVDYAAELAKIIADLEKPEALSTIGEYIRFEEKTYRDKGLITYFADEFLLDIFTDTTERAPTFMLPPFRKYDDLELLPSPAFVKTPRFSTVDAWKHYLGRELRCLNWQTQDYIDMKSPEKVINNQPKISREEMLRFLVGNEEERCRLESPESAAVCIFSGNEFDMEIYSDSKLITGKFGNEKLLIIGNCEKVPGNALCIPGEVRLTNLKLMDHMKIKLALNTISTSTMVCLGKVKSNWMSFVSMSNKKLIDRCIRLISELGEISYKDACLALHQSIIELEQTDFTGKEEPSPVQYTLRALGK
jgi:N-acetylmuramic acid 6-phosphate etherase